MFVLILLCITLLCTHLCVLCMSVCVRESFLVLVQKLQDTKHFIFWVYYSDNKKKIMKNGTLAFFQANLNTVQWYSSFTVFVENYKYYSLCFCNSSNQNHGQTIIPIHYYLLYISATPWSKNLGQTVIVTHFFPFKLKNMKQNCYFT